MVRDGRASWRPGSLVAMGLGALFVAASAGCGIAAEGAKSDDMTGRGASDSGSKDPGLPAEQMVERPWEVVSNKGETYLANVFYADASQNEQIMPWMVDGRAVIDRLVYPTIGNPNLFVKSDPEDELVMVLRIEPDAYAHLSPSLGEAAGTKPREVTLKSRAGDDFAFFLVAKSARADSTESGAAQAGGPGVFRITPKKILMNAEPDDMPSALKSRHTLRFVFDSDAMAKVPAGLYDARFEVRKSGEVYANVFEWQYNAVRVFDDEPEEYTALNVSDTQVSVGPVYKSMTTAKLVDFVDAVNTSQERDVQNAAFITFNGDLHNGGSPETLLEKPVATTYNEEAKRVIDALKWLDHPIFLTAGNHDGYASLGHVPSGIQYADGKLGVNLQSVIEEQNNIALPDYSWDTYTAFLSATDGQREGLHRDVFTGGFKRSAGTTFAASFAEVPRSDRNIVLYDGFHQWQKTYGPLYASWTFGKNRYVSVNSYELRQHRRTGWGMFTVNYGGGMSRYQMEWLDREIARGKQHDQDVVLLMHHDPRGGHNGKDFGYYFPLLEYKSVQQSTLNYLLTDVFNPMVCNKPAWSYTNEEQDGCLHDGLQEWMAPDQEFDADWMSGVELLKRIAKNPQVRTLLLGHTHYNSLEVLQKGDPLVPSKVSLTDDGSIARLASAEADNPVRRFAWEARLAPGASTERDLAASSLWGPTKQDPGAGPGRLGMSSFDAWRAQLDAMLGRASGPEMRVMAAETSAGERELAVIRVTSEADLSNQKYGGLSMFGYGILHVTKQAGAPKINRVTFFIHEGPDQYAKITTVDVDRTKSMTSRAADNPVAQLFEW